jgi:hypothetical protein
VGAIAITTIIITITTITTIAAAIACPGPCFPQPPPAQGVVAARVGGRVGVGRVR